VVTVAFQVAAALGSWNGRRRVVAGWVHGPFTLADADPACQPGAPG
jgi:hypothetical protein